MGSGVLAGYPIVDVKVELIDGSYHDVDSSERAFKIAGSMAFKEAVKRAKPILTEPVMAVEVTTPEDYLGDVIGNLNSRRGRIESMTPARQRSGDQGERAALGDVRLRNRHPLDVTGPCRLHHAVRPVRGSPSIDRRRDQSREQRKLQQRLTSHPRRKRTWQSRSSSARSRI